MLERTDYRQLPLRDVRGRGDDRWDNVQELQNVAAGYDELAPDAALAAFLEDVALISDADTDRRTTRGDATARSR